MASLNEITIRANLDIPHFPPSLTATSVRAEQTAAAERARIEESLEDFGTDDPCTDGDIITFERCQPGLGFDEGETITLRYAFIRSGGSYYGTGRTTPQGVTYARLVEWLIDQGVILDDVGAFSGDDADDLGEWL